MLRIEKTLKELRDLQNTLLDIGIEMSIKDADAAMAIDVCEPCRCFAWVGVDGVIRMRGDSYHDFARFRVDLLLDLARGYMSKVDNITKSWTHLRRNLDGRNVEMPLPDKLAERKAEYENAANRLRDLIKADPIAMDLSPYECERLERFLRDPQKERLLEYDPDDPFYRNMFNRGLIDRDGLTELGRKAMEHYVASA